MAMPYVFSGPGSQNTRVSHSSPAAILTFCFDAPRSERVFRWWSAANSLVTANAFRSVTPPAAGTLSPRGPASFFRAVTVLSMSLEATGFALLPFFFAWRNSARVEAYSGTTSICPFSRAGSYSSRWARVCTRVR